MVRRQSHAFDAAGGERHWVRRRGVVAIAGVEGIQIGESIIDLANPAPLEPLIIDEPTLAMLFTINNSPFAGREGQFVTSRDLRSRLDRELLTNVSLRVEDGGATDTFRVLARGEPHPHLQLLREIVVEVEQVRV